MKEKDDYKNSDWLKHQYYELGKSIQDIANEQGASMITIRKWLDMSEEDKQKTLKIQNVNAQLHYELGKSTQTVNSRLQKNADSQLWCWVVIIGIIVSIIGLIIAGNIFEFWEFIPWLG